MVDRFMQVTNFKLSFQIDPNPEEEQFFALLSAQFSKLTIQQSRSNQCRTEPIVFKPHVAASSGIPRRPLNQEAKWQSIAGIGQLILIKAIGLTLSQVSPSTNVHTTIPDALERGIT